MAIRRVIVVLALLVASGCRSSDATPISGGVAGGIGDDVCALMLAIDLTVIDTKAQPIPAVELWEVNRRNLNGTAYRLGSTDEAGHLRAPLCYMGSLEYAFWRPAQDPIRLQLFVMKENYAMKRFVIEPSTTDALKAGSLLDAPPGEGRAVPPHPHPDGSNRAFRIPATVTLARAE